MLLPCIHESKLYKPIAMSVLHFQKIHSESSANASYHFSRCSTLGRDSETISVEAVCQLPMNWLAMLEVLLEVLAIYSTEVLQICNVLGQVP